MNGSLFDEQDLQSALAVLRAGGVILYPTDTVWGIGCDATLDEAVSRIYALKERADTKSMLVLWHDRESLAQYVMVPAKVEQLLDESDKPTTIIYPKVHGLSSKLVAEDGSVGVRLTKESFTMALCEQFGHPIVSTSANISGEQTPRNYEQISDSIRARVDYICMYRRDDRTEHEPSRIIRVRQDNTYDILRK